MKGVKTADASEVKAYGGVSFRGMRVEGTFTRAEVEEYMEQARQKGKAEGFQEAQQKMAVPLKAAVENMENILDEFSRFRRELFQEAEKEILDFMQTVCKKILFKELSLDPQLLVSVVNQALAVLEKQKKISIEINSADFETFSSAKPGFLDKFKSLEQLEIACDSQIQPGTAVLKTKVSELDVHFGKMVDHLMNEVKASKIDSKEANNEEDKI